MYRPVISRPQASTLIVEARAALEIEQTKGCLPTISLVPVELEPPCQALIGIEAILRAGEQPQFVPTAPPVMSDWERLNLSVHSVQDCDWLRHEHVVKKLSALKHRVAFEITGNREKILITFLCHKGDAPVVRTAVRGYYPYCELSTCREHPLDLLLSEVWQTAVFKEFYTPPPYSHLLTWSSGLKLSPLEFLISELSILESPSIGVYQVIVQPVAHSHAWNRNVEFFIDLECLSSLYGNQHLQQRYGQQALSDQTNSLARDKSHMDKPFFCALVRVVLIGLKSDKASGVLRALDSSMNLFRHGGRPLESLTHLDYLKHISIENVRDMFHFGITHRAGSLLNSTEICGLLHIPPL